MVSKDDIRSLALLAKLDIPEEELDTLTKEMDNIIAFADAVNAAPVSDTGFDNINGLENVLREDTVIPSFSQEEILGNAPDTENGCFLVKKRN